MVNLLSIEELKALVKQPPGLCVSIYMPVAKGTDIQQNPIRFKNLIREAEDKIVEYGFDRKEAVELLQPVIAEIDRENFWETQSDLLAIFVGSGFFRYYSCPVNFEELVVVSNNFHVKPLIPLLAGDNLFYVLALGQQEVRPIECTAYSAREIAIENWPKSLEDALQYDPTAKDAQFRIATSKGGTNNAAQQPGSFHGQGSPDRDDRKQEILQYFHIIDGLLHEYLHDKKAPLVLAGVEYLFPVYREANTYPHLIEEGITGNQKLLKPEELREEAWPLVEPLFMQAQSDAIEHYRELTGTEKISADLQETVSAAYFGRVDRLFVALGVQQWGNFNPETNAVQIHPEAELGDEDLLNAAAIQTILNGGTVYAVPPEQVSDEAPLAAIFRY